MTVTGAAVTWPLSDPLDGRIGAFWLNTIGAADLGVLLAGLVAIIGWTGALATMNLAEET